MIPETYKSLIELLIRMTEGGKLSWERTSLKNKFRLNVGRYYITIEMSETDQVIISPFTSIGEINFLDSDGNTFESIKANTANSEEYNYIQQLYPVVRRNVLKIDDKINDIFTQLDNK